MVSYFFQSFYLHKEEATDYVQPYALPIIESLKEQESEA